MLIHQINNIYIVGNDIIERRGYSFAKFDAANDANDAVLRDRQEYCVRSWLSLLGGNASTRYSNAGNCYD